MSKLTKLVNFSQKKQISHIKQVGRTIKDLVELNLSTKNYPQIMNILINRVSYEGEGGDLG